jgi:hypothetical protein
MDEQAEPVEAARALSEIGRRREQALRRAVIPGWYWWVQAVLVVALAAAMESGRGVLIGMGIALFTVGSFVIDRLALRALRSAPPHRSLSGPRAARKTLIWFAVFVAVLLGVVVATALGLNAAGVHYPATIAAAIAAVLFAIGGQMLMRYETDALVRRSRGQG